jgi:hypothetical protein
MHRSRNAPGTRRRARTAECPAPTGAPSSSQPSAATRLSRCRRTPCWRYDPPGATRLFVRNTRRTAGSTDWGLGVAGLIETSSVDAERIDEGHREGALVHTLLAPFSSTRHELRAQGAASSHPSVSGTQQRGVGCSAPGIAGRRAPSPPAPTRAAYGHVGWERRPQ